MVTLQLKKQRGFFCGREVKLKPWSWSMHPWSGSKSCSKDFLCQKCSYWWSCSKSLSSFLCLLLVLHSVLFEDLLSLPNSSCCSSCDKSWWFKVICGSLPTCLSSLLVLSGYWSIFSLREVVGYLCFCHFSSTLSEQDLESFQPEHCYCTVQLMLLGLFHW